MAVAGLPHIAAALPSENPLLVGVVRAGVVDLFPQREVPSLHVEVGTSFVWWGSRRDRRLCRVVGAAPSDVVGPARLVILVWVGGAPHEMVVFVSEVEFWWPPRRAHGAGDRLRPLVGDPLR